jgi:YbbR domain-containing protein
MIIFVRNLVVKDFWLKLFAFALAVLIWLTVKFSIRGEGSFSSAIFGHGSDEIVMVIPVHVPATDPSAYTVQPPQVQVTLHGDPKLLKSLADDDVQAQVDIPNAESAEGIRQVRIILPQGVAYSRLSRDVVDVRAVPKTQ